MFSMTLMRSQSRTPMRVTSILRMRKMKWVFLIIYVEMCSTAGAITVEEDQPSSCLPPRTCHLMLRATPQAEDQAPGLGQDMIETSMAQSTGTSLHSFQQE